MSEFFPASNPEEREVEPTPSEKLANILRSYGDDYGMDEETCQEIAEQPFEEAFETSYSYLTSAGLEADIVLADFIESPEE